MYESEIRSVRGSVLEIPPPIRESFQETLRYLTARSVISWSEHCTECAIPACYDTCDFFEAREDGKCRRFLDGMVPIRCKSVNGYVLKIRFKRWAKLWAYANSNVMEISKAKRLNQLDRVVACLIRAIPFRQWRIRETHKRYGHKKCRAKTPPSGCTRPPDGFCIEVYNPQSEDVDISVVMKPADGDTQASLPYQAGLTLKPGYGRHFIPRFDIARLVRLEDTLDVSVIPNEAPPGTILYIGLMDFVCFRTPIPESLFVTAANTQSTSSDNVKARKCVVWDLDNTVWNGILIEDGPENLELRKNVKETIEELDARGILQSVSSKNNERDALAALSRLGLEKYFLCPRISWNPKSQGIAQIASDLNIGLDTLLFVDDSAFERNEVSIRFPAVSVIDAADIDTILTRPDCDVPITEESRMRRQMYREQFNRSKELDSFDGDYESFLRNCQIQVEIRPLEIGTIPRVYELAQRTNQMNFSGNRYTLEEIERFRVDKRYRGFVLRCKDRFGSYGIVGFCLVDNVIYAVTDMMFSFSVQSKHVEHAFLAHLIEKSRAECPEKDFIVFYRPTERNAHSARVFQDLGFLQKGDSEDGRLRFVYQADHEVPVIDEVEILS